MLWFTENQLTEKGKQKCVIFDSSSPRLSLCDSLETPLYTFCSKIQSVFQLSDGSGLAVTVARYETPAHTDIDKV